MTGKTEGRIIRITGIVQGVGFRPFVYRLAESLFLKGFIRNTSMGVHIQVEGYVEALASFARRLKDEAPPLAHIDEMLEEVCKTEGFEDFVIQESEVPGGEATGISPDISTCADCREEFSDSACFRYHYPFINCTNCGPRFSIIKDIPYDRENTTMAPFQMCRKCAAQYSEPKDRRYHAQPVACEECGPTLFAFKSPAAPGGFAAAETADIQEFKVPVVVEGNDEAAGLAAEVIAAGGIAAVKGIGGYHLACNAANKAAILELRKRKSREEKPFALMASDIKTISKYCYINEKEAELLQSAAAPIVLLEKKRDAITEDRVEEDAVSGFNSTLGFMLPFAPVHLLLFDKLMVKGIDTLIMTSGNRSNEPVCYHDGDAFESLSGIADCFLANNREIMTRTDDSIVRVFKDREYIIRRSRGYVPIAVSVPEYAGLTVLACGGQLKNTFCLNRNGEFILSHHIGDLDDISAMKAFEEGVSHFSRLFRLEPGVVAYDLHPDYMSTRFALASGYVTKTGVQHHKAHIASCMAENNLKGEVIGIAFDGTGYGEDGNLWGGEFFTGSPAGMARRAHLRYVRLPGGEAAIREPWRMAASYMKDAGVGVDGDDSRFCCSKEEFAVISSMTGAGFNSPYTSSLGRLFDAVSSMTGICRISAFEGQAAMKLEYFSEGRDSGSYKFEINMEAGAYVIDTREIIRGVAADIQRGIDRSTISDKFHETVAVLVEETSLLLRKETGLKRVVLSGGVFQNMRLLGKCLEKLEKSRFEVYIHRLVPANDGGLSLGQAVIAIEQLKC